MKEEKKFKVVKPHFRFHFRKYKTKSGLKSHPALVVGSNEKEYAYNSLTHSKKDSYRNNRKLIKNPNVKDKRNAYLTKGIKSDVKSNFSIKEIKNLKLDPKDEKVIINILKKNKHFN